MDHNLGLGSIPNEEDETGDTALLAAAEIDHLEIAEVCPDQAPATPPYLPQVSDRPHSTYHRHLPQHITNIPPIKENTPFAPFFSFQLLLLYHANGSLPASINGQTPFVAAARKLNPEVINPLLTCCVLFVALVLFLVPSSLLSPRVSVKSSPSWSAGSTPYPPPLLSLGVPTPHSSHADDPALPQIW